MRFILKGVHAMQFGSRLTLRSTRRNNVVDWEGHMDRSSDRLRQELVNHLRKNREEVRRQWVRKMEGSLRGLAPDEIEAEFTALHDTFVDCLEGGKY